MLAWRAMVSHGAADPPPRLVGLDPTAVYQRVDTGQEYPAAVLTHHGLPLDLPATDYASALIHLRRVPA